MSLGEFDVIARYFTQPTPARSDVLLSAGDDCALLKPPEGSLIAVTTDTLVENIHFLPTSAADDVAYKAFMVNLSDIAAMGATPAWASLAITLPTINHVWLSTFSQMLFTLLDKYNITLIGGDTTRGPLSITLTLHGLVPQAHALTRAGAKVGDKISVTGTLGDSAAGLALVLGQKSIANAQQRAFLLQRHRRPEARLAAGLALSGIASACIDLSDGLISDLVHILKRSRCGATLALERLPLSAAIKANFSEQARYKLALSGGEDFELCFTVPPANATALEEVRSRLSLPITCIGEITAGTQLVCLQNNQPIDIQWHGFDHFGEENE